MPSNNAAALAKQNKLAKGEAQQIKNFLQAAMRRPEGLAFLYNLLSQCHCWQTAFTTDPHVTAFNLGEQNIGLQLTAALIEASEAGYLEVLKYGQRRTRQHDSAEPKPEPGSELDAGDFDAGRE